MCLGGMRSPRFAVHKLPKLQELGARIRLALDEFLSGLGEEGDLTRPFGTTTIEGAGGREALYMAELQTRLREVVLNACGPVDGNVTHNADYTLWSAELVRRFHLIGGDPDAAFCRWLVCGVVCSCVHCPHHVPRPHCAKCS